MDYIKTFNTTIDVNPYKELFSRIDNSLWDNPISKERDRRLSSFHQVYTLPLLLDLDTLGGDDVSKQCSKSEYWDQIYIESFFNELCEKLNTHLGKGYPTSSMFDLMEPKGYIEPHTDNLSLPARVNHRIHVPIVTDPSIIFTNETDVIHMKEGHIYEIENHLLHSVSNPTDDIRRIHLLLDWHIIGETAQSRGIS